MTKGVAHITLCGVDGSNAVINMNLPIGCCQVRCMTINQRYGSKGLATLGYAVKILWTGNDEV
ncbi:MAG TPA: hypothetical protein VMR98_03100 [Candidatus Polarisedimenticolaceae bacterium]|nr:hypothetical protein [Candidatus Polarisedimenticolaceae bacterium]